jgi:hypothetical protein
MYQLTVEGLINELKQYNPERLVWFDCEYLEEPMPCEFVSESDGMLRICGCDQ